MREGKPEPKDETAADEPLSVPLMSTPSSETERYRLQAKTADLRRDEAERKCGKLREQLASAEAKLYLVQNQKEQQDLQLAGVEERLQTLNKLRDTATHDRLQQERDLSRLRAELEASKAGVTKREAELTLAQQELARKEKHAAAPARLRSSARCECHEALIYSAAILLSIAVYFLQPLT